MYVQSDRTRIELAADWKVMDFVVDVVVVGDCGPETSWSWGVLNTQITIRISPLSIACVCASVWVSLDKQQQQQPVN